MNAQPNVLLTGAGFTHNFGAPLAADVWSSILSHPRVQIMPRVRAVLLNEPNFEVVYDLVLSGEYTQDEKDAIKIAVTAAYNDIDGVVRSYSFTPGARYPINIYGVQRFISRFSGLSGSPGFFFTLNQDLFVERHYYNGTAPCMPGISSNRSFSSLFTHAQLNKSDTCTMPTAANVATLESDLGKESFLYIKLHGSSNWYSADGQQRMVIGNRKEGSIHGEPLLAKYFETFKRVLVSAPRRLLTVGYGFGDEHVNTAIADGIANGLQLHILSPSSQSCTKDRICASYRGDEIWAGLYGYYGHSLLDLFPGDQSQTAAWNRLQRDFFGDHT